MKLVSDECQKPHLREVNIDWGNSFIEGRQLLTAAITISQHGGRRSRYKIIFSVHEIIEHPFLMLGFVYIEIACILILNTAIWMVDRNFWY